MLSDGLEIRVVSSVSAEELARLYREAGWLAADADLSFFPAMFAGSFRMAAAFADGRLVGFGRVLSDGASDGCIQDVVVAAAYRRRGIGARLVRLLLDELAKTPVDWIQLIGEPGSESFYRKLGFSVMTGCTAMKYGK